MAEKLEVFLVEDDENDRNALIRQLQFMPEDFTVTGYTDDSEKALHMISRLKPHAVILDLELKRGGGDGLDLLTKLKPPQIQQKPFVLVTTNNISSTTHAAARGFGCDYIMTKNEGDYSPLKVANFLRTMKQPIFGNGAQKLRRTAQQPPQPDERQIKRRLRYELNILGLSNKSLGYGYITEAVILVLKGCRNNLAQRVAKLVHKSEKSVERAMQNEINRAWNRGDPDELQQLYTAHINPERGVPTVTELVYYYAQKFEE